MLFIHTARAKPQNPKIKGFKVIGCYRPVLLDHGYMGICSEATAVASAGSRL